MTLFDAIYLNSLGGKKLLKLMISKLEGRNQWDFILDSRLKSEYTLFKMARFKKTIYYIKIFVLFKQVQAL